MVLNAISHDDQNFSLSYFVDVGSKTTRLSDFHHSYKFHWYQSNNYTDYKNVPNIHKKNSTVQWHQLMDVHKMDFVFQFHWPSKKDMKMFFLEKMIGIYVIIQSTTIGFDGNSTFDWSNCSWEIVNINRCISTMSRKSFLSKKWGIKLNGCSR